jgi:hypothetical protein
MLNRRITRLAAVGVAVMAIVAGAAVVQSANAATQANGSDGAVYIGDSLSNALVPAGQTLAWTDDTFGFGDPSNVATPYVCPVDATGSVTFVAPKGQERTVANWSGTGTSLFAPAGTKNVAQFNTSLYGQNGPSYATVKSSGGDYSVGLACTINNGTKLASAGVYFASIHVTAVTGDYTVTQPDTAVVTPPASGSFDQTLQANTLAAVDGNLNLIAPTNATATIGNPVLDPITKLSTSTGVLGDFSVQDDRVVSHPGWTLTSTVTDFVNGSTTIDKKQLGIAPKLVSTETTGAAVAAAQVAGSGVYPSSFAATDASGAVGKTVLNADLKFVAPASAPAGTYTSKLTLTLASK